MSAQRKGYRAGIDIGGTFTDFILLDEGAAEIRLHKRLTTPEDPSSGALGGLDDLMQMAGIGISDLDEIVHGTTLVTNAVIERKGARLGMITTQGFRDVIEIGTEQRYDIYDLTLTFPEPLVPRARRLEIAERMGADGDVIAPLDEAGVAAMADKLAADGVEAIAVCLMHAYRNNAHERRVREIIAERHPGIAVSISSEVVAEISEYQRFVTTCANAYVQPLMAQYLAKLQAALAEKGFHGAFRLMHSAGGLVSVDEARAFPIRLLESGPAGGALATAWFGKKAGHENVIAFDMGGTTAKTCLIENGMAHIASYLEAGRVARFRAGSGLPIKAPVVDMIEIGAGGGSIASIDKVGLLQVGPRSAGASPGPACYGKGGTDATVTDASVALGYYDPGFFLGGRMTLDLEAAETALDALARPLGLSSVEAAWGIHQVVGENMASATRIHLVEKGKDPRGYAMIGFGGAGPAFAARVARILGIREVIIPQASGAASAFGFLTAPLSFDLVQSRPMAVSQEVQDLASDAGFEELVADGCARLVASGVAPEDITVERSADMRLIGQVHEITVPVPQSGGYDAIRKAFEEVYEARYTQVPGEAELEILSFRVRVSGPVPEPTIAQAGSDGAAGPALKGTRQAYFDEGFVETRIYDRKALRGGDRFEGPAIIEEPESTTIVPPGDEVFIDGAGNICITIGAAAKARTAIAPDTPQAQAMAQIEADPISLEIMWSRLVTVAEEMWQTVCRTAYSLIISESQDFGCSILDANGDNLAHSARVMPVFNLTLPLVAKAILERYPADTLQPGDVLVCNDPWLCAGHLFDVAVITPVFKQGRVVALMGTVGHVGDIGGTRNGMKATELYEEGLQIPPMKLVRAGIENEDLFRIMGENIRDSQQVLGDIRSLIAANATGAKRLEGFLDEYGLPDLTALAGVIQSRSEKAMRDAISALPDGRYEAMVSYNPLGTTMDVPVAVTIDGDACEIDFEGAPAEVPLGGINCTMSYTTAHSTYPLKCMLTPGVRGNAGCFRPFTVKAPQGSVLNCNKPAPVSLRTRTGWYTSPNLFRALSDAAPDKVIAHTGLPSLMTVYGKTSDGALFYDHLLSGGGQGASQAQDGKSSLLWPTSAATSSVELLESRSPVVVHEKAFVRDSGGAGAHRGGLGARIRLAKRYDDGSPVTVFVSPEGVNAPITGLFGGQPGLMAHGYLCDPDGTVVEDCGSGGLFVIDRADRVVELQLGGGSGFGDPLERPVAAVERDLAEDYISAEAAEEVYRLSERRVGAAAEEALTDVMDR
ncbi:hydantoinase B/oxoprolinase family protein [Salipiger sp. P9]|uniref:hydantoinase B/oxoprolinase family protein n=1 Tax=Salipiger pentaromativorans TaxID=2943193 RepID=UPI0021588273|nr:hydantoinase B/oxoprolinase family protein [Salipiger pentaromativorans]MCR8548196.1 hydantoinase B/oxoprolinase family protein [Salipiger pentaromativorans]